MCPPRNVVEKYKEYPEKINSGLSLAMQIK